MLSVNPKDEKKVLNYVMNIMIVEYYGRSEG